jgi:aryl-alcohol dehydrogenase-like predicted oxidoreductase
MPRFAAEHWPANLALHRRLAALARAAGCSVAQLSLAWVLSRGPQVLAIPGTTSLLHLHENLATPELPADVLEAVSTLMTPDAPTGNRYGAQAQTEVDTETF